MVRDALAEIAVFQRQSKGVCKAALAVSAVCKNDESLRPGLERALAPDSALSSTAIAKWFQKEGVVVSDRTILRHRKGECAC